MSSGGSEINVRLAIRPVMAEGMAMTALSNAECRSAQISFLNSLMTLVDSQKDSVPKSPMQDFLGCLFLPNVQSHGLRESFSMSTKASHKKTS